MQSFQSDFFVSLILFVKIDQVQGHIGLHLYQKNLQQQPAVGDKQFLIEDDHRSHQHRGIDKDALAENEEYIA